MQCARSDFVPVLVDEEEKKVIRELGSAIERHEDVVEAREESLPSDLDRILSLLHFSRSDFETGVKRPGDVLEEQITRVS